MTASDNFFTLLIEFEGFVPCPYLDSVKVPTIGIGTTVYPDGTKVKMTDECINREKAITYVKSHIWIDEKAINANLSNLTQNQFDALLSFTYNVGVGAFLNSTLLKKAKKDPNDPTIANEFAKWNKAGGKVLKGLTIRRKKESDLYFK